MCYQRYIAINGYNGYLGGLCLKHNQESSDTLSVMDSYDALPASDNLPHPGIITFSASVPNRRNLNWFVMADLTELHPYYTSAGVHTFTFDRILVNRQYMLSMRSKQQNSTEACNWFFVCFYPDSLTWLNRMPILDDLSYFREILCLI